MYCLFGGETRYIIETGFSSLGRMIQNFVDLSTFTDPLRTSNFPQNWTIYYWVYWMVWCVAAPFFIGSISRGRTVRQTILVGYVFGVGSILTSFIVLGNYSMGIQVTGKADFIAQYLESGDLYGMIVSIIKTMPGAPVIMVVVLLTMIAFYATSFDSIALTASCYSYHTLKDGEQPNKGIQLDVVHFVDFTSDCFAVCRKLHEQSSVSEYCCSIPDWCGNCDDCCQLYEGC